MLVLKKLPRTILWVINLLAIYILLFTLCRFITFFVFKPADETFFSLIPSFLMGLRFDLRWISLLLLPLVVTGLYPRFSPFYSERNKNFWTWYLALATFFVFFFFAADFGCFSYNKTRLNASALNFVEDPTISAVMLWQSYPMLWFLAALFAAVFLLRWIFRQSHVYIHAKKGVQAPVYWRTPFVVALLALCLMVHGSAGREPLRWNTAFTLHDSFRSYLALNPLQNFFTTLKFRKPQFDEKGARTHFPVIAGWLQLPKNAFSFKREVAPAATALKTKPNIVLVLCESFSMYKSSMSGNPLNTTPYFQALSDSGIFFERCFTPHFSTARGLFATLTGIPDVQLSKFSTRSPEALQQHTIINDFKDYRKLYFLGGSPTFNNFEGLLKNINGLEMHTEGKFSTQPNSVWGISDKELFLEANKTFARQQEPFFAIVQTADNHRPFTIPVTDADFERKEMPLDSLKKYGFESLNEYNSFRYADYCFRQFIEAAKKEAYFDNTVFVFVGDHGVSGNARALYPEVWTTERLTDEHVPLLFYAPRLLAPQKRTEVVSQVDVLPAIASLSGQRYTNTTLGRDIITTVNKDHYAFIIYHDEGQIGLVTDSFYYTKNLNFKKEELHWMKGTAPVSAADADDLKAKMSQMTTAYYETAKWMLVNNGKESGK